MAPFNVAKVSTGIADHGAAPGAPIVQPLRWAPVDILHEALLRAGFKEEELDGSWTSYGPVGCDVCRGTGYKGRTGIYEIMPITDAMTRLISMKNGTAVDIADLALREGMVDLRHAGLLKVKQGVTSLAEIEVVTND